MRDTDKFDRIIDRSVVLSTRIIGILDDYELIADIHTAENIYDMLNNEYNNKYMVTACFDRESFNNTEIISKLKQANIIIDVSSAEGTKQLIEYMLNNPEGW